MRSLVRAPPPRAPFRPRIGLLAAFCLMPMLVAACAAVQRRTPCDAARAGFGPRSGGTSCLHDAESGTYTECFHVTANGRCAHFGAACAAGASAGSGDSASGAPCLHDSTTGSRRACHHVTAGGGCAHFGAPCPP